MNNSTDLSCPTKIVTEDGQPLDFVTPYYGAAILAVCIFGLAASGTNLYIIQAEKLSKDVEVFIVLKMQVMNDILTLLLYPYYAAVIFSQSLLVGSYEAASYISHIEEALYACTASFQIWVAILRFGLVIRIPSSKVVYVWGTVAQWIVAGLSNFLMRVFWFRSINYFEPICACYQRTPDTCPFIRFDLFSTYYFIVEVTSSVVPVVLYGIIIVWHVSMRKQAQSEQVAKHRKAEFTMTMACALNATFQGASALGWRIEFWVFNFSNQLNSLMGSVLCLIMIERINRRFVAILKCKMGSVTPVVSVK